jgi:hypothetical protein
MEFRLLGYSAVQSVAKQAALLAVCFLADFLLAVFFDPENGGDMFLRNIGWLSTDYTASYARR